MHALGNGQRRQRDAGSLPDANDYADAQGAVKGDGDVLLPFFVMIDTGECTPPSSVSVSDSVLMLGTPSATPDGGGATRGGSPDARASVCVSPSNSAGPLPPPLQKSCSYPSDPRGICWESSTW